VLTDSSCFRSVSQLQEKAFEFGQNIAFAHQLKEELQCIQNQQSPINIVSLPAILSLNNEHSKELIKTLIKTKAKDDFELYEELSKNLHQFLDSECVTIVEDMMSDYSQKALAALKEFPDSETKVALENIVLTVSH